MGPSKSSMWIAFTQNLTMTYSLNFLLFTIHWDILENCKVWTKNMMVMFGASCRQMTSIIHLVWALEQRNVLVIYVVEMIIVLCSNILLLAMKLFGVAIIPSFQNLGIDSWNLWFVPSVLSFMVLCPPAYKFAVAKCIVLFTSFQIFQEQQSTWASMHIQLQKANVKSLSRRWRT